MHLYCYFLNNSNNNVPFNKLFFQFFYQNNYNLTFSFATNKIYKMYDF